MKLTENHIEELYVFTRQHFVEHFDVQTELVDHLANDIEMIWEENPTLSFEKARDITFKKFGIFGFMDVVEEKQKQVEKKYTKILWSLSKKWFKLPKIFLIFSAIIFLYYAYQTPIIGKYLFYSIQGILLLFISIKVRKLHNAHKNKIKKTDKNWLLEEMIFKIATSNFFTLFANIFNIIILQRIMHESGFTVSLSILTVLLMVVTYITLEYIPKHSEKLLEEYYPEYKLV